MTQVETPAGERKAAPAETLGTPVPAASRAHSLSPSRASDFLTCPLLYRFRVIDRLPEPPSPAAVRGTVVHAVLEQLFDLPATQRTAQRAKDLVAPAWSALTAAEPEVAELFAGDADGSKERVWLEEAAALVDSYFRMEDPRRLEPAERELHVETTVEGGLVLRGYVDRLDVAPTGDTRIVDYKTGKAPPVGFEHKALFQLRFYALVLWRLRGQVPRLLQLMYLGDGQVVRYEPDEADLLATERKILSIWRAIERATARRDFPPRTSKLCDWCPHRPVCPAFDGTPPPFPAQRDPAP